MQTKHFRNCLRVHAIRHAVALSLGHRQRGNQSRPAVSRVFWHRKRSSWGTDQEENDVNALETEGWSVWGKAPERRGLCRERASDICHPDYC